MTRVNLARVTVGRCLKPGCGKTPVDRHHKSHEALWFGAWAHRRYENAEGRKRWRDFKRRYAEFREQDIVRICSEHHAEIHMRYDEIIAQDIEETGLPLYLYSWTQGRVLMRKLRRECAKWMQQSTPGVSSEHYEAAKRRRRAKLKKPREKTAEAKARAAEIRSRRPITD